MRLLNGDIFIAQMKHTKRPVVVVEDKGEEVLVLLAARFMGNTPKNLKVIPLTDDTKKGYVVSDTTAMVRKDDLMMKLGNMNDQKENELPNYIPQGNVLQ